MEKQETGTKKHNNANRANHIRIKENQTNKNLKNELFYLDKEVTDLIKASTVGKTCLLFR